MQTFTCSTSKQSGVPGAKTTIKNAVSMLTTGKICVVNLTFIPTRKNSVQIGKLKTSSVHTRMVARMNIDVNTATGGRNSSTILKTIK